MRELSEVFKNLYLIGLYKRAMGAVNPGQSLVTQAIKFPPPRLSVPGQSPSTLTNKQPQSFPAPQQPAQPPQPQAQNATAPRKAMKGPSPGADRTELQLFLKQVISRLMAQRMTGQAYAQRTDQSGPAAG